MLRTSTRERQTSRTYTIDDDVFVTGGGEQGSFNEVMEDEHN